MPNPGRAVAVHRQVRRQPVHRRVLPRLVQQLACRGRTCRTSTSRRRRSAAPIQQCRQQHSNEIDQYYDTAINVGGPIKQDKSGGSAPTASSRTPSASRTSTSTRRSTPSCGTRSARAPTRSTRITRSSATTSGDRRFSRTACRLRQLHATPHDRAPTNRQDSGSWVYKGEWNGTLSDKLYVEARYGDFGYYFPQITNGTEDYLLPRHRPARHLGSHTKNQIDRDRKQLTGGRDLLPRHRQGQPHVQGRRRAPQGAAVDWLPAGRGRQHRAHLQQRRRQPGDLRHPDGARRSAGSRTTTTDLTSRNAPRCGRRVRERHLGGRHG